MSVGEVDRLTIRTRPGGLAIMHQNWGKLLFMHWPIPAELLRPLIPQRLTIDIFEGQAWIGIVPFTMWDIRAFPPLIPALPGLSRFHELNVRTYVHLNGVPGVWFFSLDAAHALAVYAARTFFHLPYFNARMRLDQNEQTIFYSSHRAHKNAPPAEFEATWKMGQPLPQSEPDTLQFFLTERYCLYAAHKGKIYRCRIFHQPWPLQQAQVLSSRSTMIESLGLPTPHGEPLLHYAEEVNVDIWSLTKVLNDE